MVPSFVQTSTSDLMDAPRALALLPLSLQTMLATPSSSSTAMTGRAAPLRFVRIASLALDPDSVAVEALVVLAEASEVLSALVEDLELAAALVAVLVAAVVALVVDMEVPLEVVSMREPLLRSRTPLQTTLPLEPRGARSSMFAT